MSKRILMVEHQKDDRQIGLRTPGKLIFPEVFESVRSQGRVADRGHDRSVAEIGLDGSREFSMETALPPVKTRMDVQAQRRPILPGLLRANGPALRVAARKGSPAARLECRSKICRQKCQRRRSKRPARPGHAPCRDW